MTEIFAAPDIPAHPIVLKHLPTEIARTMLRFHDELLARFPGQIRRLILFGSQARGGATAASDVDVMVVIVADAESFIALARQLTETHV